MPKPFKIEDSPLFQITLPGKKSEKKTKQKQTQTEKRTEIPPTKPLGPFPEGSEEFIKKLTDNLIKYHNPTEHIVYITLLKFSKIVNQAGFENNKTFEIITDPISINKIANLCNISFKTAKRTIRNLIKKGHISIFSPHDSKQNIATRYKIEITTKWNQ